MFSIKSTWEAIKLVCGSFMIRRHSFIPWLAVFDRLATRRRQLRWGRSSDDKCLFCNSSSECRDHFFFLALLRWVYGRVFSIVQRQVGDWPMEFQWAEASLEKKFFKSVSFLGRHSTLIFIIYGRAERRRRIHKNSKILILKKIQNFFKIFLTAKYTW